MIRSEESNVFVAGKPLTDIWSDAGLRWRQTLAAAIETPLRNPRLHFIRNDRSHYDLDNLVYPVLEVAGCASCESVWASVGSGAIEGVWLSEQAPPGPPMNAVALRIEQPNVSSDARRIPPPELRDLEVVAEGLHVALALQFDSGDVPVGEMSYEGPTKSLIDDLAPLLGTRLYRGRVVSNDERVKELRISRNHRPAGSGVRVSIWPAEVAASV